MVTITATTSFVTDTEAAKFVGCSAEQQQKVDAAATNAQKYATAASKYLNGDSSATPRYTTWFGTYDADRHNIVKEHFSKISGNKFAEYTYDCITCTHTDVYAYVYPTQYGKMYLCPVFWRAPATGTDSQAGTIVAQASLFAANGGTHKYVYGQPACRRLANSSPVQTVMNADSYQYFAENNPPLA
ncbi:peptidyl-Lys metalloendopeptidase [Ramicandelaber brevisporus]|nr:peptidyl-Lys metalloendopeptidase [Ramicandelaber brevisporus]